MVCRLGGRAGPVLSARRLRGDAGDQVGRQPVDQHRPRLPEAGPVPAAGLPDRKEGAGGAGGSIVQPGHA